MVGAWYLVYNWPIYKIHFIDGYYSDLPFHTDKAIDGQVHFSRWRISGPVKLCNSRCINQTQSMYDYSSASPSPSSEIWGPMSGNRNG